MRPKPERTRTYPLADGRTVTLPLFEPNPPDPEWYRAFPREGEFGRKRRSGQAALAVGGDGWSDLRPPDEMESTRQMFKDGQWVDWRDLTNDERRSLWRDDLRGTA